MKRRYRLDTGPAFDCIFRRRGVFERVREARSRGDRIGIGYPVLAEIISGVEGSQSREHSLDIVQRNLSLFILWPFDLNAVYEYGRISAELRRRGRPMQQNDIQIAAIALSLGNCIVVSGDSDLQDVSGLTVENWSSNP
jgi:tRNA(fMet)-specific endonuclease VapC